MKDGKIKKLIFEAQAKKHADDYLKKCEAEIKERRENGKSDKTCEGCYRCEAVPRHREHPTGWHCCSKHYDAGIFPSDPACDIYWDRAEEEKRQQEEAEKQERERLAAWEKNKDNPPVKLPIVFDGFGYIPECPNCHEMPYDTEQCHWCGQKFIQDEEIEEYNKPLTKEGTCMNCGKPVIYHISRYNGHKRYRCDNCGMAMME
jgi:DNA-directed RNA polymerase subunit RPC12/RpoP